MSKVRQVLTSIKEKRAAAVPPPPPPADAKPAAPPVGVPAVWRKATDKVDRQVGRLQDLLRKTGDKGLASVADQMTQFLTKLKGDVAKPLNELAVAPPDRLADARQRASAAVVACRQAVATDKVVAAADANPFKVPVSIRATLGKALDTLAAELAS